MDYFKYMIVGSGPAGIAAALKLENRSTCIIDVGEKSKDDFKYSTLNEALASGDYGALLGDNWEMLANIVDPMSIHAKLRSSGLRHINSGEPFSVFGNDSEELVKGFGSYAEGGMAGAWGAQLYRYTEDDLNYVRNWPLKAKELDKYYKELEEHIGISGELDDMSKFLGMPETLLLPPIKLVPAAKYIFNNYAKNKGKRNQSLIIGRPRLGVLTKSYRDYSEHNFGEIEFFSSEHSGIYTPKRTLKELKTRGIIKYFNKSKVIKFREYNDSVEVLIEDINTGALKKMRTNHLLLGCGTIQTAILVLKNKGHAGISLPFIDHPPTLIPLFFPKIFGNSIPQKSFPVQLVSTFNNVNYRDMISLYYPGGLLWSDLLTDIPLSFDAAIKLIPIIMGGMLVAQIWETSYAIEGNKIKLLEDGTVRIYYPVRFKYKRLSEFISAIRKLGGFTLKRFALSHPPSWGFHHAGCLPMRSNPNAFETHSDGRLWDSKRIRIIDASIMPSLPAKNHSFTMMANAARIADMVSLCGY